MALPTNISIEVLHHLAQQKLKLMVINDRVYLVEWWEAATTTMLIHKMKGRDITKMIGEATQFTNQHIDENATMLFLGKAMDRNLHTIEFHHSTPFVYYLS